MDTLLDLGRRIESWAVERGVVGYTATWSVVDPVAGPLMAGVPRQIPAADLTNLSDVERSRLLFQAQGTDSAGNTMLSAVVDIRARIPSSIKIDLLSDPQSSKAFQTELANAIIEDGTPRFDPQTWKRTGLYVPVAVLTILWLMLELTSPLPLPAMLFGWVIVISGLVGTIALDRSAAERRVRESKGIAGGRIRSISRAELRVHRADARSNIKVVAITAPISIAVGVIGTAIAFALKLKS